MRARRFLWGILIVATLLWGLDLFLHPYPKESVTPFTYRTILTNLSGIIAFFYMGLVMLLATRPKWLEEYFGGLDKLYYLHKWAGIWAISASGIHYLIRLSKKILVLFFEKGAKIPLEPTLLTPVHDYLLNYKGLAKELGEYVVWILLVMLLLTLWNRFSYHIWRYAHKIMGALFLILAFHTLVLTPINYWYQPLGIILLLLIVGGSVASIISLFGLIGRGSTYRGEIIELNHIDETLTEVTCQLEGDWHHKAGQYAFFKHDRLEGAHPFTISSHDGGNQQIRFSIKALGDYTAQLQEKLAIGDRVEVEGPYGRFDFKRSLSTDQIWIGAGVGVTPFIAWLEALANNETDQSRLQSQSQSTIDFYYSIRNESEGGLVPRLEALAEAIPNVTLHIHYSDSMGHLTLDQLPIKEDARGKLSDIWFCGPNGFGTVLKNGLKAKNYPVERQFHQEIFQMR